MKQKRASSKIFVCLVIFAAVVLFNVSSAYAAAANPGTSGGAPAIGRDHPLYFVKRAVEGVRLVFSDEQGKASLHQEFANARIAEAKALYEKNKTEGEDASIAEAESEIEKSAQIHEKLSGEDKLTGLDNALARHQENARRFGELVTEVCTDKPGSPACTALTAAQARIVARNTVFEALAQKIDLRRANATH